MKLLSLKESDEKKLREGLAELRKLHEKLSSQYLLKADLVELNDRRFALRTLLDDELNKVRAHQQGLENKTNELSKLKIKLEESLSAISEIEAILEEDEDSVSRYSKILELTSEDSLNDLQSSTDSIHNAYNSLFASNGGDPSKIEQAKSEIRKITLDYEKLFTEEIDEDGGTRISQIYDIVDEFEKYYADLFETDDPDLKSKKDQINDQLNRIQNFYDKIYGNEGKKLPSLVKDLDERLTNLKNVEERAKSVIGLSSEAGLAGGFVVKGKEAKEGQKYSIIVFVVVVLAIFGFNIYLFDKNDFLNMKWDTFLFKLLINAPLIWIATIANINLNKFSRLEQEYSHKEALAKSYERYKSEIQELEHLGVTGAEELKLKLLEINLEAFKVNPAEHSDKSKPDFSIWDLVRNRDVKNQSE
ncbi:hypothetical protein [Acinetobacter bereziniae]|uniref:hypothetical protein n=1 Tax=Acinetobacter bereziniae TaxID=106648 RepID=UPI002577FBCF|nr:hypothetical protein [Acinetobacter bereziniae]MDM1783664.1 hypothetical protein [Acinetobacter bereziniae]